MSEKQLPATTEQNPQELLSKVFLSGDFSTLTDVQQWAYVEQLCGMLGLNAYTQPFSLIKQKVPSRDGGNTTKIILYANKACAEQLCAKHNITTELSDINIDNDNKMFTVKCCASLPGKRSTSAIGAVSFDGLKGEFLANAMMKTETKATRRSVLRLMGLGMIDETEAETINGEKVTVSPPTVETAESNHQALEVEMIENGKLSISQRKECIAWMRQNAAAELRTFITTGEAAGSDQEGALVDKGVECLATLKLEDTDEHLNDCLDAALLDAKEKIRRTAAAETVKGKAVPKGGAVPKPAAASASTTSATNGGGKAASVSTAVATGTQKTQEGESQPGNVLQNLRSSVPSLKQINGATSKADTVGTKTLALAANPGGGVQVALSALLNHLGTVKGESPTASVEGAMLKAVAVANGWSDKQRGFVMANVFEVTGNKADPEHPINFTYEAAADMANYFASHTPAQAIATGVAVPQ
jgi:hypothetical protein